MHLRCVYMPHSHQISADKDLASNSLSVEFRLSTRMDDACMRHISNRHSACTTMFPVLDAI